MDLIYYLNNNLITDNTKDLTTNKIFLKTFQNQKYATNITKFITPKELLDALKLKTKFIGITGTNGKTTTAFVLSFLLKNLGFNVVTQGTEGLYFNLEKKENKTLTTPDIFTTIKRAYKYKPDFFVMEVSSHAIAQNRIEGIRFDAKIMTSFSQDHLDYHKSMDEYKKVKESFFQDESVKVINGKLKMENGKYSIIEIGNYDFKVYNKNLYVLEKPIVNDIPMAGEFNKMNFSLALKTAEILTNSSFSILNSQLKNFKGVSGRMEIVSKNPLIIVDFAHTPDGIEKVLSSVKGEKIVVFGAGGNRDKEKRELMGKVASKYAEFLIITNDNPRCESPLDIANDIAKGVLIPYEIILDRKEAIKKGVELGKNGKILFVLGKGDEEFIEYCDKKEKFKDKNVILEILGESDE
ncbi:UDP-N-acetylmuramoyl-L-alanyl-D-glutamate--2,6-diaminopimelate ligase [Caminibacter mediatlanticus TB-2]|uniref:UDP-N-acetylmuramoyl-L-alanyl-D-glutamate--2, 6-diaminopimelate ligase n=1 Tax=Caminibacter mediatlanticus TB-2 TaxID=391592 RepID=A0ABX5V6M9_9BACT|nr:UDP-N-acetylmuramoyl-L-alanyl-D-glutamate--2,6-diaminopimelate ligase [Caminibacter mediatlanticus]QCT93918.1 UDP-N-acetylmuramoyl-L-alanyl-D-glutamate--2,6-diaminopimelate ligase [Caminibacter mediatlanticus TB-2]